MTSQGHAYAQFRRALDRGDLRAVRLLALELQRIGLDDALKIVFLIRGTEPKRYEAAATRWLSRLLAERTVTLDQAAEAVEALRTPSLWGRERLGRLAR
jgi:hypothetical protein